MEATYPAGTKPIGYEQLTISSTALNLNVPKNALRAVIGVESQSIRWRDDGTDPTDAIGMLQKADIFFEIYGPEAMAAFKAIRATGSDGTLNVSYYA
jgi:hypothetical protein